MKYFVAFCNSCRKHSVTQSKTMLKCKYCNKSIQICSKKKGTINIKFITLNGRLATQTCANLNMALGGKK